MSHACCHEPKKTDYFLHVCLWSLAFFYGLAFLSESLTIPFESVRLLAHSVYDLVNTMWWGLVLGVVFVGLLDHVPRDWVMSLLGRGSGFAKLVRATLLGFAFDLCSHGVLMVGMKLYERGFSLGQVMAFLISSPWNSFSLTFILWSLIGLPWTLMFILLSALVALLSGLIFDRCVDKGVLPPNPHHMEVDKSFDLKTEIKNSLGQFQFRWNFFYHLIKTGLVESQMVLRWFFFGILLASLIRVFVPLEIFQTYFGATLMGLGLTLVAATVIEVCSEGSVPIAADLLTRAQAPGNSFAFLMGGVSTDYTEVMALKETTRSWKIALFLPLVTLPQIILIAGVIHLMI